jgi:hypothetical protein
LEAWLATLASADQLKAALGLLLLIVQSMGLDATYFSRRLTRAGGERKAIVSALGGFAHGTRTYLVVSTIVAAIETAFLCRIRPTAARFCRPTLPRSRCAASDGPSPGGGRPGHGTGWGEQR